MELLIGCGSSRVKRIVVDGRREWTDLVTLDIEPRHKPDVVWDLNCLPQRLPFSDDSANEIHAYEVLEHCGRQGDARFFFAQFSDFWRILKPGGAFCATVPLPTSVWAWGDPSHTRVLPAACLTFLQQPQYTRQVGVTAMSDFRSIYRADFDLEEARNEGESLLFVLRAVKPSRIEPAAAVSAAMPTAA